MDFTALLTYRAWKQSPPYRSKQRSWKRSEANLLTEAWLLENEGFLQKDHAAGPQTESELTKHLHLDKIQSFLQPRRMHGCQESNKGFQKSFSRAKDAIRRRKRWAISTNITGISKMNSVWKIQPDHIHQNGIPRAQCEHGKKKKNYYVF